MQLKPFSSPFGQTDKIGPNQYESMMDELSDFQRDAFKYNAQIQNGDWDAATDTFIGMRDKWGGNNRYSEMLRSLRAPTDDTEYKYDDNLPDFVNNLRNAIMDTALKKRTLNAFRGINDQVRSFKENWQRNHNI